ncbi:MAG: GIY-YIG nuclease family protein [Elusimicrobiota bacterium]
MIDKKKIRQDYKNTVNDKGVFAIKNTINGKVYLGGTLNLYNILERNKFRLNTGSHQNERLQKDWKSYGEGAFTFEILEKLKLKDDIACDYEEDLKILEMIWVEKYQPIAEKLYNENENIRTI